MGFNSRRVGRGRDGGGLHVTKNYNMSNFIFVGLVYLQKHFRSLRASQILFFKMNTHPRPEGAGRFI